MRATSRGEREAMSATPGQRPQKLLKKVRDVLALIQSDYEALVTSYYAGVMCMGSQDLLQETINI